ncbi:MAG TPA: GDP-mannose 4,6-dehydratase [Kofleriaceae bacterium]|nr:GDP-mannose 4,6-dehydratase [Kofleriaceae bacterium]
MSTTKVLITGITGFAGSHLMDELLAEGGHEIWGLKRPNARMRNLHHALDRISLVDGDLLDQTSLIAALGRADFTHIYHLGAQSWVGPSWEMPAAYMATNAIGTIHLFEAMRVVGSKARVLISCTPEEYGDVPEAELPITEETRLAPINPYAASKVAQDAVAQTYGASYGFRVIRTRAFNHEGPRRDTHGALASFAHQIARIEAGQAEPIIRVGNLSARRNFTHVRDICRAYRLAMQLGAPGELYLLGSNQAVTIEEALRALIRLSRRPGEITYVVDPARVRPTELRRFEGDYSKFKALTGWEPRISFEEMLISILDYWRDFVARDLY